MQGPVLTPRQQQVVWLRYVNHASIDQISSWLHITPRAVLTRLQNARKRGVTPANAAEHAVPTPEIRRRLYTASQLPGAPGEEHLSLDNV
jgi:DNA-binding transcriptional regulator LsrR (DeoR family)